MLEREGFVTPTLQGRSILVLDLETLHSAQECKHCGFYPIGLHMPLACPRQEGAVCEAIGWDDFRRLGLSIGCYYDYLDESVHFFDQHTLLPLLERVARPQTLLVSFNGVRFDFPLLAALCMDEAEAALLLEQSATASSYLEHITQFESLIMSGYDILQAIRIAEPKGSAPSGTNSLAALSQANGLPPKQLTGALAPQLWAQGRCAEVINYNLTDVLNTKALFERIIAHGGLNRRTGWLTLPTPHLPDFAPLSPGEPV